MFFMCMCDPFGVGRGEVTFCPQVARFQRYHPRLLLRASPPETRAKNNIPIYKFPETSIGITSCIYFGDESKNLLFPVPYSLFPIIHHHPNGCFANGNAANG